MARNVIAFEQLRMTDVGEVGGVKKRGHQVPLGAPVLSGGERSRCTSEPYRTALTLIIGCYIEY